VSSEEVAEFTFQMHERAQIGFVTEFTLSEVLYLEGRIEQARETLAGALKFAEQQGLDKDNPKELARAYFFLGFLYIAIPSQDNSDLEQAVVAYTETIRLDPTFHVAHINRAMAYSLMGMKDEAMAEYTALIESESPMTLDAYLLRAALQPTRALAEHDLAAAIELNPLQGLAARGRQSLYRWNDPEGAIPDLQQALQLNSSDPYLYHHLGYAQLRTVQTEAAMQTYHDAKPHLTPDALRMMTTTLEQMAESEPDLREAIAVILQTLKE
jgi:tetratricopeptide (TPR) repeat protein